MHLRVPHRRISDCSISSAHGAMFPAQAENLCPECEFTGAHSQQQQQWRQQRRPQRQSRDCSARITNTNKELEAVESHFDPEEADYVEMSQMQVRQRRSCMTVGHPQQALQE